MLSKIVTANLINFPASFRARYFGVRELSSQSILDKIIFFCHGEHHLLAELAEIDSQFWRDNYELWQEVVDYCAYAGIVSAEYDKFKNFNAYKIV